MAEGAGGWSSIRGRTPGGQCIVSQLQLLLQLPSTFPLTRAHPGPETLPLPLWVAAELARRTFRIAGSHRPQCPISLSAQASGSPPPLHCPCQVPEPRVLLFLGIPGGGRVVAQRLRPWEEPRSSGYGDIINPAGPADLQPRVGRLQHHFSTKTLLEQFSLAPPGSCLPHSLEA